MQKKNPFTNKGAQLDSRAFHKDVYILSCENKQQGETASCHYFDGF